MFGTIDGVLSDFAESPSRAWAREAVIDGNARIAENRLLELLNMGT